jgi:organic hydroperoxide reductase OsmC/OhrA
MKGLVVDEYRAEATGILGKNSDGKMSMTEVVIKPTVILQNNAQPDHTVMAELFKKAHDNCFISNSVKTTVRVESPY